MLDLPRLVLEQTRRRSLHSSDHHKFIIFEFNDISQSSSKLFSFYFVGRHIQSLLRWWIMDGSCSDLHFFLAKFHCTVSFIAAVVDDLSNLHRAFKFYLYFQILFLLSNFISTDLWNPKFSVAGPYRRSREISSWVFPPFHLPVCNLPLILQFHHEIFPSFFQCSLSAEMSISSSESRMWWDAFYNDIILFLYDNMNNIFL